MIITFIFKAFRQILGINHILLAAMILLASCNEQGASSKVEYRAATTTDKIHHSKGILALDCKIKSDNCIIYIYNNTSYDSIIGEPHDSYQGYIQAKAWSNDGPYPPKFFDLKILNISGCDSFKVEMNISNSSRAKTLLSKNVFVYKGKDKGVNVIKDIQFESIYNKYPTLGEIRFYILTYSNSGTCSFMKKFVLHAKEDLLEEQAYN